MAISHRITPLDVIQAVHEVTSDARDLLPTVSHLLISGQVRCSRKAFEAWQVLRAPAVEAA